MCIITCLPRVAHFALDENTRPRFILHPDLKIAMLGACGVLELEPQPCSSCSSPTPSPDLPRPPIVDCNMPHHLSKGAIVRELGEIVQDPFKYVQDKWNVLDVASLCLMFMGLCYRAFGDADSNASISLYALSTPLAFSRVLFYAQLLPSQGPMIQVNHTHDGADGACALNLRQHHLVKEVEAGNEPWLGPVCLREGQGGWHLFSERCVF